MLSCSDLRFKKDILSLFQALGSGFLPICTVIRQFTHRPDIQFFRQLINDFYISISLLIDICCCYVMNNRSKRDKFSHRRPEAWNEYDSLRCLYFSFPKQDISVENLRDHDF